MDFTARPIDSTPLGEILDLERLDTNRFRGRSQPGTSTRMFGGEVAGQAVRAATLSEWGTTGDRVMHHGHASFLRAGNSGRPVTYQVVALREGRTYTTCRVDASQGDDLILTMTVGFVGAAGTREVEAAPGEAGMPVGRGNMLAHQAHAPLVAAPEACPDPWEAYASDEFVLRWLDRYFATKPFEARFPTPPHRAQIARHGIATPRQRVWLRLLSPTPATHSWRVGAISYISDAMLLTTALGPHGLGFGEPRVQLATITHTMWFHEDTDPHDWFLYDMGVEWSGYERGLCVGAMYDRAGVRIASFAQEGLMRLRE